MLVCGRWRLLQLTLVCTGSTCEARRRGLTVMLKVPPPPPKKTLLQSLQTIPARSAPSPFQAAPSR